MVERRKRLAAGDEIDGFRLQDCLHRSAMASLWRARRADLTAPVLLKIPSLSERDDPTAIVGFEVEQMIMPRLAGEHVPKFLAAAGFEAQPYIAMELIEGHSLRERFDEAPLEPAEVAAIGARVAAALHDLHRQHVIHLDLKPSNILIRPDGTVVLIDFGLARHDHLPDLLAEEFRLPMGTAPYISPEQVRHNRSDPRSDLFALGVLLYHLATGKRPFGNPTTVAGLRERLYRPPVPPRAHNATCPPWLQEVILHCLEVDPEQRYGSAGQVAFDLQQPDKVALTARAERLKPGGLGTRFTAWLRAVGTEPGLGGASSQIATAPIVMVAVDLFRPWEALDEAERAVIRHLLQNIPNSRLACVSVLRTPRIAMDDVYDEAGRNQHVKLLVGLRFWARSLQLPPERVTYHVLKSPDPISAIIDYASTNHVDHIIIGAGGVESEPGRLGPVVAGVVARAACSVTVVRPPAGAPGFGTR